MGIISNSAASERDTLTKDIVKNFRELKKEKLVLNNRFGNITVKTWSQPFISINIRIIGRGTSKPAAEAAIKSVEIKDSRDDQYIICNTTISGIKQARNADRINESRNIHYLVLVPDGLALEIISQFGNVMLGDYQGELNISQRYGNITAGKLSKIGQINLKQGNLQVKSLAGGFLTSGGFERIIIENITGNATFKLTAGNQLDVGLVYGLGSFNINAANVGTVNVSVAKGLPVKLDMQTVFSPVSNNSGILLLPDSINRQPKKKTDPLKPRHFTGSRPGGNLPVKMNVSFTKVNLFDSFKHRP